jgi:hypothetical protein
MEPVAMAVDDVRGEFTAHRVEHARSHPVFEPRDRRLRGDRGPVHRITPQQQFVNRVVGEPIGVVRIGMATREPVDAEAFVSL